MDNNREWKEMLIAYEQAVEELKVKFKAIRKEYRDLGLYSPIEFVTGRVKKISSIIEKAQRYHMEDDEIEEKMEDIAGIRIMCQFTGDIFRVAELLRERDGKDLMIMYEKDYINNPKPSGYKSHHMIIKYPVQTALGEREILAEIQIRTLAMNFWATIEHSLNYKYQENIPAEVRKRLKSSAEAAWQLDNEMTEIRNEVINAQMMFEQKSNVVADIVNNLKVLFLSDRTEEALSFRKRFEEIYDIGHGDADALEDLLEEMKEVMPRYKVLETDKE